MSLPHLDGCIALLCAVARQWANDARTQEDANELAQLAGWLGMAPDDLRQRLGDAPKTRRYLTSDLP